MGVIDNANLIKQGYINACNAVLGRGGSITSGAPIGDLAEAIINIPHDTTLAYHTVESETYHTKVPSNVEPFAKVNKIGGMTYKTEQGLCNASVTALESHGVNYLDLSGALNEQLVDNGDGTYTMTHNGGNYRFSGEAKVDVPFNVPLIIYGELIEGVRATVRVGNDNGWLNTLSFDTYVWLRTSTPEHPITKIQIYMQVGEDGLYAKIKHPRIVLGQTLLPYKPYVGKLDKIEIPEAVRNLEGYGQGVEGYPNTIEWRDGRCYFVQRAKQYAFDGTEKWYTSGTNVSGVYRMFTSVNDILLTSPSNMLAPSICNYYKSLSLDDTYRKYDGVSYKDSSIFFYNERYNTSDTSLWKSYIAELYAQNKPLEIIVALAEPIETDITDLMRDNFITVEGDGTLTAINEYEYDVLTSTTYLIETVGG